MLTEPSAIKKEAADYFQNLLQAPPESDALPPDLDRLIKYTCPSIKVESLVAHVTEAEVK